MARTGRPKKEIDWRVVRECSELFCSQESIATILGISTVTLRKDPKFLTTYRAGRENAKKELHRFQWISAARGNVQMQIWLGKNYLGQKEPKEDYEDKTLDLKDFSDIFLNNYEERK